MTKPGRLVKGILVGFPVLFAVTCGLLLVWLQYPTAGRKARSVFIQETGRAIKGDVLRKATGRPRFMRLVSIGDSFSDTGRLKARTLGLLVPDFAFFEGRCSNGPLWIEYVKGALDIALDNYAYGGATTSAAGVWLFNQMFLNFQEQVQEYFKTHPDPIRPEDTIITITGGGNNLFIEELRDYKIMKTDLGKVFRTFYEAGARRFVFLGIGNWRPPASPLDQRVAGREAEVFEFLGRYHQEMRQLIEELEGAMPDLAIEYINTDELDQKSQKQPEEWGFRDVQSSCFKGDIIGRIYAEPGVCQQPHETKFWEHFHLSSKMHCHIAVQVLQQMSLRGWIESVDASQAHRICRELGLPTATPEIKASIH